MLFISKLHVRSKTHNFSHVTCISYFLDGVLLTDMMILFSSDLMFISLKESEWLLYNTKWAIFSYTMERTCYMGWDDFCFVLDQHPPLVDFLGVLFNSAISLKQQWQIDVTWHSTHTHFSDLEPTSLCSYYLMLHVSGEATNTNFIVFWLDLTRARTYSRLTCKPFHHRRLYIIKEETIINIKLLLTMKYGKTIL